MGIDHLIRIVESCVHIAHQAALEEIGVAAAVDAFNHREMIFQKVILPSFQFLCFLITNRHILNESLLLSFMELLGTIIQITPLHRPTLEFVLASPILIAFSSLLSFSEDDCLKNIAINKFNNSLAQLKRHGPAVEQSGKRILQSLVSEGFEEYVEQLILHDRHGVCYTDLAAMSALNVHFVGGGNVTIDVPEGSFRIDTHTTPHTNASCSENGRDQMVICWSTQAFQGVVSPRYEFWNLFVKSHIRTITLCRPCSLR
ncbi:hypothetical protein BLNAU_9865 [Blattamonas nauphoetae]|uniref:Uncharacterized protein n=1 Tax=Blattamonas nauphoetae TaxID=2049346 RepID=A0ABQ9XUG7_9EUKA|nr:hypothetical protein BLNAU_9865 [Blattamonas nauphoetae]